MAGEMMSTTQLRDAVLAIAFALAGVMNRSSWAYCPQCRRDLNGDNDSFIDDIGSYVRYTCASCGFNSQWDFDAPAPVYLYEWTS